MWTGLLAPYGLIMTDSQKDTLPAPASVRPTPAPAGVHALCGRVAGTALIVGPIVWLTGVLLRSLLLRSGFTPQQLRTFREQEYQGTGQLTAHVAHPALATAGYAVFLLGAILLWPAVTALARIVQVRAPVLGLCGGGLFVAALFARAYFAGADQTAFRLADEVGAEQMSRMMLGAYTDISYGPWRVPVIVSAGLYLGTALLAAGAWRAGVFGTGRSVLFLLSGVVFMGVLKESRTQDVIAAVALCTVLAPLGLRLLRGAAPWPGVPVPGQWSALSARRRLLSW